MNRVRVKAVALCEHRKGNELPRTVYISQRDDDSDDGATFGWVRYAATQHNLYRHIHTHKRLSHQKYSSYNNNKFVRFQQHTTNLTILVVENSESWVGDTSGGLCGVL